MPSFRFSLKSITASHEKHKLEYEKVNLAYESSQTSLEQNTVDHPQMEKAYQFYQQCRAYAYSYLECYNEKVITLSILLYPPFPFLCLQMIVIINLEDRLLQLYKQRTDMIVTRRQEDVKDQCMEYSIGEFLFPIQKGEIGEVNC